MSFTIEPAEKAYFGCNSCDNHEAVYWVRVTTGMLSTSIKLCVHCRADLIKRLRAVTPDKPKE